MQIALFKCKNCGFARQLQSSEPIVALDGAHKDLSAQRRSALEPLCVPRHADAVRCVAQFCARRIEEPMGQAIASKPCNAIQKRLAAHIDRLGATGRVVAAVQHKAKTVARIANVLEQLVDGGQRRAQMPKKPATLETKCGRMRWVPLPLVLEHCGAAMSARPLVQHNALHECRKRIVAARKHRRIRVRQRVSQSVHRLACTRRCCANSHQTTLFLSINSSLLARAHFFLVHRKKRKDGEQCTNRNFIFFKMSWQYNPAMRAHPSKMPEKVARGSVQAGFFGGNQSKKTSRANVLRSTRRLAPIVNSAREQRRRAQIALATPPAQPIIVSEQNASTLDALLVRVEPRSLRVARGSEVTLQIALDASDLAAVEWRAFTPSTNEERIVRNDESTITDAPLDDTVYSILFQAHERSSNSASQQRHLVGHHYEIHVRVDNAMA